MNHVFENFGKMWRGGKYVEASDVASAQYDKLKEAEANHSSFEKAIKTTFIASYTLVFYAPIVFCSIVGMCISYF